MTVSEWADNYGVISQGNAEPGRWKTSRAEYQRAIMDAFTEQGIQKIVVKSSSQIGKSSIINHVIARFSHLDPCAMMMVQPTIEMAEDYSKTRIAPMLRDTAILTKLFSDAKSRDGNNTILNKIFPGGRLIMCGANSPAGLASRPIRLLLCDEVDRYPLSAGTEGDPVDLAAKRQTTFWNKITGLFSTPTVAGISKIEKEYLLGTQEEWRHECPNCKEFHVLKHNDFETEHDEIKDEHDNITFVVKAVRWRCPSCGFAFDERQIKDAPQKYVAVNPAAKENGVRSFFINAFSTPWLDWAKIMTEWLEARGNPQREQVVMNTRFGETYRLIGAYDDENQFLKRREDYGAELPRGVLVLTAAVDTQSNRLEYEICGWGKDEECWGILRGILPGNPDRPEVWRDLDAVLDREYRFSDGRGLKIARTFIDTGGLSTSSVYSYCRANLYKQRIGIKGQGGAGLPLNYKTTLIKTQGNLPLQILGVNEGKQQVLTRLGLENQGQQYFHFPLDDAAMGARGYDRKYFKGLISEQKKITRSGGQLKITWEPISKQIRNEPLDLRVYNLACVQSLKIDWDKQGDEIGAARKAQEKPKPIKRQISAMRSVNLY